MGKEVDGVHSSFCLCLTKCCPYNCEMVEKSEPIVPKPTTKDTLRSDIDGKHKMEPYNLVKQSKRRCKRRSKEKAPMRNLNLL